MLTKFYLDGSLFQSALLRDEALSVVHDTIIESWRNYGVLIMPQDSARMYYGAIKSLPAKFHQRWIDAFTCQLKFQSVESWGECGDYKTFEDFAVLCSQFKTAVVEDTVSSVLCDNDSNIKFCPDTSFEVVGSGVITESRNFEISRFNAVKDIEYGSSVDGLWCERFKSIAEYHDSIYISDRYVFDRILDDHSKGFKQTSVFRLMGLLSSEKKTSITILSDGGGAPGQTKFELCNYFEALLKSPPIAKKVSAITLISMPAQAFQKHAHDRYIRFGRHVFQIGVGMSIFERHTMQATTFTIKQFNDATAYHIEKLAQTPDWRTTLVAK
jgi:hypothetical protein